MGNGAAPSEGKRERVRSEEKGNDAGRWMEKRRRFGVIPCVCFARERVGLAAPCA
jgi:hypothetical protein